MKRTLIPILFAATGLFLSEAAHAQTRVMLLGDSLTAQSSSRKPLYDRLTAEGYDFEFVGSQGGAPLLNEGHSGFTIGPDPSKPGNLFDNIGTWIPAAKPDVIFLLIGNNEYNTKRQLDPGQSPGKLKNLLDKIHELAPKATIIVGTVLKVAANDDFAGDLNRTMPGIVEEQKKLGRQVYFADLHTEVDLQKGPKPYDQPGGDFVDGVHLNSEGGKKLANAWYTHLVPFLKKK